MITVKEHNAYLVRQVRRDKEKIKELEADLDKYKKVLEEITTFNCFHENHHACPHCMAERVLKSEN